MKKMKRIFLIFMSVCIFGITIYTDYQTVKAVDIPTAFWGTLEAARAFWTALNAGGGVRGGGVSLGYFERSSREDMHNLQTQVMIAYTAFCIWKEKQNLSNLHPDWSEEEINQQSELEGRLASDRFQNSVINVNDTTNNLTIKDFGYWKEFCDSFNNIARNGLGDVSIGENTVINVPFYNGTSINTSFPMTNIGANTFDWNGYFFVDSGQYFDTENKQIIEYSVGNVPTDRIRVPYFGITWTRDDGQFNIIGILADFNRLTGEFITSSSIPDTGHWVVYTLQKLNEFIENCNFPIYISSQKMSFVNIQDWGKDYNNLSVAVGGSTQAYEQDIENALNNTEAGKAIKEGAKNGQEEIIKEGYIPVKRSSVRTGEETATGAVGWDVPDTRTLEGAIAVPDTQDDVVEGMGIINVPKDRVTPNTDDTVAEWAKDEPISIPDTKDEPISKPIDDVISEQYGDYYPTQISLGDFFPFCIPFDIYYCVQKFNVSQGEAPIIHIPIVYPRALQSVLGESYDVVIDFNNYIVLRNIIRGFILIFFIVGLMQITRNLIRG